MSVAGEKNNVDHDASLIIGSSLPDLVVLTFEPPSGAVNRTFTISNAVRNQGAATAGPFTVWFALSSDTTFTLEDTLIGTREIRSSLGVGAASATQDTTVTIPDSVPGGSYYVGMIVDTTNAVAESDETNNFDYDPDRISILAAQPPDIGFWIFFTDPGWDARVFDVDAEVRNYGTGPTGPFTVGFYLSNDTTFTTADILIGEEQVADLAADATAYVGQFVTVPASVPAGSYYLGMIMDTRNTVAESNEANNVVYDHDPVDVFDPPDIASWTFGPPRGAVARTFTIYNAVKNIGAGPAGPFTVEFYLSTDMTFTSADTLIGTRSYSGLDAGAAGLNENTAVTIPDSVPAGSYYLGMIMDTGDTVVESNENNNIAFAMDPISITAVPGVVTVPGGTGVPTWITIVGKYDDVNGNSRKDFADVVLYFNQMTWIGANEPAGCFDFNGNTRVDFADVVWLFNHL